MGHNMVLGCDYSYNKQKGFGGEWMYLLRGPLWWPCGCIGAMAIHMTTPDAEWQMLHWKPLDAAIGQLLHCSALPRWLTGQQSTKQRWKTMPTLLAISMDIVMRWCNTAHITRLRRSKALLEATKCCHQASTRSDIINWKCQCRMFVLFFVVKLLKKGAR